MLKFPRLNRSSRFCSLFALLTLAAGTSLGQSTTVVIDQVYGGGGGTSPTGTYLYNADYVELFNLSSQPQNIGNWSVQYVPATQIVSTTSNQAVIPAGTILAPGQRYLIVGPTGSGSTTYSGGTIPVAADLTTTFAMSATGGKVYLVSNSTLLTGLTCPAASSSAVVDLVAFGAGSSSSPSCAEGTATASPTAAALVTRTNACTDTDNNAADFSIATTPAPRDSASTATPCGGAVTPTGPTLSSAAATPSTVTAGNATLLTVTAAAGSTAISAVTVDTTALGGSATQALYDDGTHGDATAGDKIYTYSLTVPSTQAAQAYTLNFKATDTGSLTGTASTTLTVQSAVTSTPLTLTNAKANPATVTAGSATILAVTVSPGTLPPSTGITVNADLSTLGGISTQQFYDDGTHGDSVAGDGTYSYSLTVPSAQTAQAYTVTIKASDAQARTASSTAALTVQAPAAAVATVALSASTTTATVGASVTLTAVVTGNKSSTPSGTVTFFDAGKQLGTGTSTGAGTFTYTTTALALGSHAITATYSGDAVYPSFTTATAVNVAITAAPVPDFTLTVANSTVGASSSSRTQTTVVTVNMVNGFNSPVALTCSGLPSGSRCNFSPASLTASGSSTMTIAIDGAALHHKNPFHRGGETAFAFTLLALPLAFRRKLRGAFTGTALGLLLLGAATATLLGCGNDNSTPTGTTTVTVSATGGSVTHTATFNLNVVE